MAYEIISLEHEILNTLFSVPEFEIISTGNSSMGYTPLYKQLASSCFLHFGTLVDILNNPIKHKDNRAEINQLNLKKEDIDDKKYSFQSVSIAVEVLSAEGDIEDDFSDHHRIIRLTEKGARALFTKYYLKERQKEIRDEDLHNSTVDTNNWMKQLTIILAASAFLTLIIQGWQCNLTRKQMLLQQSERKQYSD